MRPFSGQGHAGEEAVEDEVEEGEEELGEVGDEDSLDDGRVAGAGEGPALNERVGVERAEADAEEFGELVVLPVEHHDGDEEEGEDSCEGGACSSKVSVTNSVLHPIAFFFPLS